MMVNWGVWPLLLLLLASHWLVGARGHNVTCSTRLYPGEPEATVSFPAILGLRDSNLASCGGISPQAFQHAVALNWATSLLNGAYSANNTSFIPGVKIGVDVYDDCGQPHLTAIRAGEMVSGVKGSKSCPISGSQDVPHLPTAGILGTELSSTTQMLSSVVLSTSVPVVGISAALPELSDKVIHPNFIRTVPSDLEQAQAIIQIAKLYQWNYVVGAYSDDPYGRQGMAELKRLAKKERICISAEESFALTQPSEDKMLNFVRNTLFPKLELPEDSIGVIFFGKGSTLLAILNYMDQNRAKWHNVHNLQRIHWLASDAVAPSTDLARTLNVAFKTKAILISPPWTRVETFEEYFFRFLEDPPSWAMGPWRVALKEQMRDIFGCPGYNFTQESLQGCDIRSKTQFSTHLVATLDSVYLLANAVRQMHLKYCGTPGLCNELEDRLDAGLLSHDEVHNLNYTAIGSEFAPAEFVDSGRYLKKMSGDFYPVDQAMFSIVSNVNQEVDSFQEIGQYINDEVKVQPQYEQLLEDSECQLVCAECADVDTMSYMFSPGDVILLGFFSLHSNTGTFTCGSWRKRSPSYMASNAFLNGIQWLRKNTDINFGYLVIDDCYGLLVANTLLIKIFSGEMTIKDENGIAFNPDNAAVAIGAQSTPITMASIPLLQTLNISMISYSASNHNLDNRIIYPYFSRTLSSDLIQAEVFVQILEDLKVSRVGAIAFQNSYGLELYHRFREIAEARGICVKDAFQVTWETPVEELEQCFANYRDGNIKVILTVAMDDTVTKILSAVEADDTFVFLGSEAWGLNLKTLEGELGERARGSLVLSVHAEDVEYGLKDYISSLDPFAPGANTWLREFWQVEFKCNLPGHFNNDRPTECKKNSTYDIEAEADIPIVVHSTIATISAGLAVNQLLKEGSQVKENPQKVSEAIRNVELTRSGGQPFKPFKENGMGTSGYDIFNIQSVGNAYDFVKVGSATSEGEVTIDLSLVKFYDVTGGVLPSVESSCLHRAECKVCIEREVSPPAQPTDSTSSVAPATVEDCDSTPSAAVIALAVICPLLVVGLLLTLIVCMLFYRGNLAWNRKDKDTSSCGVSTPRPYSTTSSRNLYTSSMESIPPLPPARRGTTQDLPVQNGVSVVDRAFSDISQGDELREDIQHSGSKVHAMPNGQAYPVPNGAMEQANHQVAYPMPRAHIWMCPDRTQVQPGSSVSSGSLSQHRSTPSPQFAFMGRGEGDHLEVYPANSPVALNDDTQVKFPTDVAGGSIFGAMGHAAAPRSNTPLPTGHPNYIRFTNVEEDGPPYYVSSSESINSNGAHYWLVKAEDGSLVPYENINHQAVQYNQPVSPLSPGSASESGQLPSHQPASSPSPIDGFLDRGGSPSNSGLPEAVLPQAKSSHPAVVYDNPSDSTVQLGLSNKAESSPKPHARHSKFQDDYITAINDPENSLDQPALTRTTETPSTDRPSNSNSPNDHLPTTQLASQTLPASINNGPTIPVDHIPLDESEDAEQGSDTSAPTQAKTNRPHNLALTPPQVDHQGELAQPSPQAIILTPSKDPVLRHRSSATVSPNRSEGGLVLNPGTEPHMPLTIVYPNGQTDSLGRRANDKVQHRISDIPEVDMETDSLV